MLEFYKTSLSNNETWIMHVAVVLRIMYDNSIRENGNCPRSCPPSVFSNAILTCCSKQDSAVMWRDPSFVVTECPASIRNYEAARYDVPGNICKRIHSSISVSSINNSGIQLDGARGGIRTGQPKGHYRRVLYQHNRQGLHCDDAINNKVVFTSVFLVKCWHAPVYLRPNYGKDLPMLYIITPTYRRPEQIAELTRLANTLMLVPNVFWLVIEDAPTPTPLVDKLLKKTCLNYEHLIGK